MEKVKEGYKMTELGEIPEEWEVKCVGDIGQFQGGYAFKSGDYRKKGIKLIRIANVQQCSLDWNDKCFLPEEFLNTYKDYALKENDIILAMTRPIISTGLKVCKTKKQDLPSLLNQRVGRFVLHNEEMNSDYLYHYSFTDAFTSKIKELCSTTGQPNISSKQIESIMIIVPILKEQQKIASILSSVDKQIEITDNLIAKTKELKKGLMQKLLTKGIGHERFKDTEIGRIPVEWEVRKLNDITEIIMGQSPDSSSYNEDGEGIPFFQGKTEFGTINPVVKKWCTQPTKIAKPFDILISVRAPVGDVNINNTESCIGRGLGAIRQTDQSNFKYLFYTLQVHQNELKKSSQGSTFEAINSSDLKGLKIPVPRLQEQQKIASILSSVDNQIEEYELKKEKLEELKKGLMQKLLSGRVRVKI